MASRSEFVFLLKLAVSAGLLWLVVAQTDSASVLNRLRNTDFQWLTPGLLIGPAAVLLSAWRWQKLSLGLIGFSAAVRYTWIGLFFGSVMPGVIGGDVAKGVSLAAKNAQARDSRLPLSIVADKLVGFWVLVLMFVSVCVALLYLQPEVLAGLRRIVGLASIVAIAGLAAGIGLCHPLVPTWINALTPRFPGSIVRKIAVQLAAAASSYAGRGTLLLEAAAISLLLHLLNALALWFALRSLEIDAPLWFAMLFYPLLSGLLALPVSISGVGLRDVFSAGMFTAFGLGAEPGVAFSWLLLAMAVPNALIGGAIQLGEFFTESVVSEPKQQGAKW